MLKNNMKKGQKMSNEQKKKQSLSMNGKTSWNKGLHWSEEVKRKIGLKGKGVSRNLGRKRPDLAELNKKLKTGFKHTEETKKRIGNSLVGKMSKEKNPQWKGGITPINKAIRTSREYKLWREAVFKRDNYTCIWCGKKFIKGITGDVIIQADHIKPFSDYPELRFAIDNGRTLCFECHKKTDTYGGIHTKRNNRSN